MNADDNSKVRSFLFIPQSHAPLSFTPTCSLKVPSLLWRVEREYGADDGFISSVSLCTKRPRWLSSQPVFGLKAARKGLPVTDRSVSHTLCGQA